MNEIAKTWQDTPDGGLLAEYGIDVQGTPEAVAEVGRKYGVRLFMSALFDERAFVDDAAQFHMTEQQARCFALNLNRYPLPAQDDCDPCPVMRHEYWRFGMHITTVVQSLTDLRRAYGTAPRGPGDHGGE